MARFVNQFHATLDEHIDFVKDVLDKYGVHATAVHQPFRVDAISSDNAREILSRPSVWRVVFTESPPVLSVKHEGELLEKNPGSLGLNIGQVRNGILEESCLSTMDASPAWKKINALLKARAPAGVIGISDNGGAPTFYPNHRLTAGAVALLDHGVALRQFAQSPLAYRPAKRPGK